jgi:tetratricopeptide (TPR) repeat protein
MMRSSARSTCLFLIAAALLVSGPVVGSAAGAAAAAQAAPAAQGESAPDVERLYNAGLYQQAVRFLLAVIANNPKDASLHDALGRCYYQLSDYNHAIANLETAIELDPSRSEYHDWLGKAYGRKAEESNPLSAFSLARKAHREFTEAVRLNPSNLAAQRDLIRYLLNSPGIVGGGAERADEQIQSLGVVDGVEGALARAEADVTRKKFELADQEYGKLLEAYHRRIGVDFEIAEYYRDRGDGEHMEQAVAKAAALDPADIRLNYYRGVALVIKQKDAGRAEQFLRAYLDAAPDNSELPPRASAREWLGRLYEHENKLDSAAEQYQAGLALDPHNRALREGLRRVEKK